MLDLAAQELILAVLTLAASTLYATVAIMFARRRVDAQARLAQLGFSAWWLALALLGIASVPFTLGFNLPNAGLLAWRVFVYTLFPLLFVGLAGLVYYLAYLYFGSPRVKTPIVVYFVLLTGLLIWLVEGFSPHIGVNEEGETDVLFEPEQPAWASLLFSLAFILPPLVGSVAYLMLYRRVDGREQKYRIVTVGAGLVLWFAYSLLSTLLSFIADAEEASYGAQVAGALLGLVSSTLVLLAFWPPRPIRKWLDAGS